MNNKFTEQIKQWLDTPESQRDYAAGALMLLQLNRNTIMYRNIMANLNAKKKHVEYQLQKSYDFRVADLTHSQVEEMAQKVYKIASDAITEDSPQQRKLQLGKRNDHDSLPENVKAAYLENYSILQRMRDVHLRLRRLSLDNVTCPDSERYPFLKELIALDIKLHENWKFYDSYKAAENEQNEAEIIPDV